MGDPRGFLKVARAKEAYRPVEARTKDFREVAAPVAAAELRGQASRCMECGIPFCHKGCPLANLIPEWNDLVYRGRMDEAVQRLLSTNNFPEVTGRVCPAPCEASCVLNLEGAPVTIKAVEHSLGERARASLAPVLAPNTTGQRVAVVGSGPAGLACAQQLARKGHEVTVYERDDRVGGLLRYGIPDFKMDKSIVDARVRQMEEEGVRFVTGVDVGSQLTGGELREQHRALVLCGGARRPRDLAVPGRELAGVHFAMDFLKQQNARCAGDTVLGEILATDRRVVVLGGGDTGSDCVGTAIRQGARSVTQLELMPKPPLVRLTSNPWPEWPFVLRTSTSQEEGMDRDWAVSTTGFGGEGGAVTHLEAVRVATVGGQLRALEGSLARVTIPCEVVLLAMGFTGPETGGLLEQLGVSLDARSNVASDPTGATSVPGVFVAGDMGRGQSLVVWAIADGRRVAEGVDAYLQRTPD
jgi:glutamate synthase (NADPH/NADH) small chain